VVTAPLYECKFSSFKSLIYKFKLLSNFLRIVSFLIDKGKITANKPHLKIMVIIFNINLHKYIKNKSNKMCLMTKRKSVEKRCNSVMHRFCHLEGGSTCATYLLCCHRVDLIPPPQKNYSYTLPLHHFTKNAFSPLCSAQHKP
jgi:superfamily I DNA and RNA helicase